MAGVVTGREQNGGVRMSTIPSSPRAFTLGDEHVAEVTRGHCKVGFHIHCLNGLTGLGRRGDCFKHILCSFVMPVTA